MVTLSSPTFVLHRQARIRYQVSRLEDLTDLQKARYTAQRLNESRAQDTKLKAADLHALALIQGVVEGMLRWYKTELHPDAFEGAVQFLRQTMTAETLHQTLLKFVETFPPEPVFIGEVSEAAYVESNTASLLENLVLIRFANQNPAFEPFKELFEDSELVQKTAYLQVWSHLKRYFATQTRRGSEEGMAADEVQDARDLMRLLSAFYRMHPNSLLAQLAFLRGRWSQRLKAVLPTLTLQIMRGEDYIREESKPRFAPSFGPPPPPPSAFEIQRAMREIIREEAGQEPEIEAFSQDLDWMPNVVMVAKSTLVWLYQLSQTYGRDISRLDQIPDEELDKLKKWGINALWFIGIWERSHASEQIKKIMGNPEASASAYSLYDYVISESLGGRAAFYNLKARAWARGIRIAADMVPNHTGLDSDWMRHHPDRFISMPEPPYPSYSFTKDNLSDDPHIGIFLEDHYYDRTDAAVVMKRVDYQTGDERYIYHGNDGTGIAWNDTAQINFLNPEAREAVIQAILQVARDFPIIRLDAAMVLAKRHIHRLWFPEPGKGGDIPSRAVFGLTKEAFDAAMPEEFWREVVDRVAVEAPDTLLLAEAFWMLEGYFVRSLGMHRVYNSAFMHMLRDERNKDFRFQISSTLEYDPEILKRYVNFLNNPDEKTAVEQFGKGDKYFGVTVLMLTLPGLPMFGHGQIEGFSEKYGMEYKRAYYNESPDLDMIARHVREVVPIAEKRYLFAEAAHFRLFDFMHEDGEVNENVLAFTNRAGGERALVLYNNAFAQATGRFKSSAPFRNKAKEEDETQVIETESLAQALNLKSNPAYFSIFRDQLSGLEFIRSNQNLWRYGMTIGLNGYQSYVFMDIREVEDSMGYYRELHDALQGRGVPNVEEEIKMRQLRPIHEPFVHLVYQLLAHKTGTDDEGLLDAFESGYETFLREASSRTGNGVDYAQLAAESRKSLDAILGMIREGKSQAADLSTAHAPQANLIPRYQLKLMNEVLCGWLCVHELGKLTSQNGKNVGYKSRGFIDAWMLDRALLRVFRDTGLREEEAQIAVGLVMILTNQQYWYNPTEAPEACTYTAISDLFNDPLAQGFMNVNAWEGQYWFNRERFEILADWIGLIAQATNRATSIEIQEDELRDLIISWKKNAAEAGYNRDNLLRSLEAETQEATSGYKFQIYKDIAGAYRFRFKSGNGQVMFASQAYTRKSAALRAIEQIRNQVATAEIEEMEEAEAED